MFSCFKEDSGSSGRANDNCFSHNVARRGLNTYNQRKLGSNTSVLRTNRIVRLDIDEGRCET